MPGRYRDVMRELIDAVVGGDYAEGASMPNEARLSDRFGCSRGVVREALRGLEERGLVEVQAARGQTVRQREYWDTRDALVLRACIERGPDPEILWQAIDACSAVESEAAVRVIRHATGADFGMLRDRIEEMQAAGEPADAEKGGDAFVLADFWFHHTLALLSDNSLLAKLIEPVQLVLADVRRARAPERDGAVIRHHRRILEGLSSREPDLATGSIAEYAEQLTRWLVARR